jgi:CubicO group peptidase (beta-lactamase class C family)
MKTNYRFFYVIIVLLGFLAMACDDEPEGTPDDQMAFPDEEWETKPAENAGWDVNLLNEAIAYARDNNSYNLMIIHRGKIVVEEYWKDSNAASQHDLNSVAKSMMSIVMGVLQQDGKLKLDDKVNSYLAPGWSLSPATEGDITIRHLLTMTSGLNEELKWVGPPGETWRYSHSAYRVLYDVMEAATGTSYRELFKQILFTKMGAKEISWSGKDLSSTAREMGRFGLMVLNNGEWNGEKIIEDDVYFNEMLSTSQSIQPAYGYLWWLNGTDNWYHDETKTVIPGPIVQTMPSDAIIARGKHDQRIYIVPSLELVVVRQAAYLPIAEYGEGSFDVEFWRRLMPAINAGAASSDN